MAVAQGYGKTVTSGSVFAYDTGDTINSYIGEPTTNHIYHQNPRIDTSYESYMPYAGNGSITANHPGAIRVYNANGVTLFNGKPVSVTGVRPDGTIEVELAISSNKVSALNTIGITTHDIEIGTYGWVTTAGMVNGICLLYTSPSPRD